MIAQQGCFMFGTQVALDLEIELVGTVIPAGEKGRTIFTRVIVRASAKLDIVRRLRMMNITPSVLFPGLDGVGRALTDVVRFWNGWGAST